MLGVFGLGVPYLGEGPEAVEAAEAETTPRGPRRETAAGTANWLVGGHPPSATSTSTRRPRTDRRLPLTW